MVKSGITKEELIKWAGDETFNKALSIVNSGDVSEVVYDDETLEVSGLITQRSGWDMKVKFHLEPGDGSSRSVLARRIRNSA